MIKKNKILKIKNLFLTGLILIIFALIYFFINNNIELKSIEIELGDKLSNDINYYLINSLQKKEKNNYKLDLSEVDINKIGKYSYYIYYEGEKFEDTIKIIDTTSPILKLNKVIITEGEELNIDMFVESCEDNDSCTYSYENEDYVNSSYNNVGDYEIKIIATDSSGNETEKIALLEVLKKPTDKSVHTFSSGGTGKGIAVLNYHFIINDEEISKCSPSSICINENLFEEHIKYIKESGFRSLTMKEFEEFIDNKREIPEKSVLITIDDGWFVYRAITILEKYETNATLFLIGSLASPDDYASKYLEVHSHGWDIHTPSTCNIGRGGGILCLEKSKLLEDLKKSRESLNDTTYFCYPFYEYNDFAINALKQSGFTMAFTGGNIKAKAGMDKFKIPRYVIYSNTTVKDLEKILN